MREEPRFAQLCQRAGLTAYWEETGLTPDFLA
jgi:preprotein translocase subunit Sec61beta